MPCHATSLFLPCIRGGGSLSHKKYNFSHKKKNATQPKFSSRFMVGFNIGCVPQSVTLYAEFLPSKQRGKCVVLLDCFWALGACFEVRKRAAVKLNYIESKFLTIFVSYSSFCFIWKIRIVFNLWLHTIQYKKNIFSPHFQIPSAMLTDWLN